MIAHSVLSPEEKQAALQAVLQSDTFARADQLKEFLSYVCEREIAGRVEEISEYQVGLEVLRKPEGFSTVDDPSVRNRAYALRKKLDKFYAEECSNAPVRIEFVKGTYVPRFVQIDRPAEPAIVRPSFEPPLYLPSPSGSRSRVPLALAAGIAIGAALTLLVVQHVPAAKPAIDPIIREAWGPLLDARANVLISLGSAAQMTLLPFDVKVEWRPELPVFKAPPGIYPWYVRHHRLLSASELYMMPDINSPHFGDVLGATLAAKLLTTAGGRYELLPERAVSSAILGERNSILFGVPHKSEAIFKLLENTPFQFTYDPAARDVVVTERIPGAQRPKVYTSKRDERDERTESFGLISVSPVDLGNGNVGRRLAFSGDPSAGAAAAVEFFSSASYLRQFRDRLRAEGYKQFPSAYQVLIRCKLDSNLPASFAYEAHAVPRQP